MNYICVYTYILKRQIQIQNVFIDSQYMVQQLEQQTPVCH